MTDFKRPDELQPLAATARWPRPDVCVVQLAGDLDATSAPELTDYLRRQTAAGPTHLLLDLSAVTFLAAAGVTMIVNAQRGSEGIHGELHLIGTTDSSLVERVLHLTGVRAVLSEFDNVEQALRRIDDIDQD